MLKTSNLTIKSQTRTVIDDVSIEVAQGQIVALLGPNGAGKSELVLGLAGVMPLTSGAFAVDERFLNGKGIQAIRAAGIATVPEGHQVLGGLSVLDNLKAAGHNLDAASRDAEVESAVQDAYQRDYRHMFHRFLPGHDTPTVVSKKCATPDRQGEHGN